MTRWQRRLAKTVYLGILFLTGLLRWARSRVAKRGVVVITLHRVLPDEQYDPARLEPGMVVRASTFERLLRYLNRNCKPILPDEVAGFAHESTDRPRVVLTFDDGWKDNFETAFPLGQRYRTPFAVFICPRMIDGRNVFWTTTVHHLWCAAEDNGKLDLLRTLSGLREDGSVNSLIDSLKHVNAQDRETLISRLQAALSPLVKATAPEEELLLTWAEVKSMAKAGIAFGSHTNTHRILTDISEGDAAQELAESKRAIEAQLNACLWFAYPNGDWSQSLRDLVARSGYRAAFANSPGVWEANSSRFSIPRINLWEGSMVGFSGRFSRIALEYAIFWKAYRARSTNAVGGPCSVTPGAL